MPREWRHVGNLNLIQFSLLHKSKGLIEYVSCVPIQTHYKAPVHGNAMGLYGSNRFFVVWELPEFPIIAQLNSMQT